MHYLSYDGDFFQAHAMQAIYHLFMKFQCVICILYQNVLSIHVYVVTGTGQYWYDNNHVNTHTLFNAGKLHTVF
jgi:hypothetical protein